MKLTPKTQPFTSIMVNSIKSPILGGEYVSIKIDDPAMAVVVLTPEEALTVAQMIEGIAIKLKKKQAEFFP